MASVSVDHNILRNGTPPEVARYLQLLRSTASDVSLITAHLHHAVTQEAIPQSVFAVWTPLHHDPISTVAGLRQSDSLRERHVAIEAFVKAVRSPEAMSKVWDAAGGASGIMSILNDMSVNDVKLLCNGLARTASLSRGRSQRRAKLTELVDLLLGEKNTDSRPLQVFYKRIIPACTAERVAEHERAGSRWSPRQRVILLRAYPEIYEKQFEDAIFSSRDPRNRIIDEDTFDHLVNNDYGFAKRLLKKFVEHDGPLPVDPRAFMTKLATPIAKRLRRKGLGAGRDLPFDILELLSRLISRHSELADCLDISLDGFIFRIVKFWEYTRGRRPQVEGYLAEFLGAARESHLTTPESVMTLLRIVNPTISYRLFRLIGQYSQLRLVDDTNSILFDELVTKLKGPWPADLFTMLAKDKPDESLALFERFISSDTNGNFLDPSIVGKLSITEIAREPTSNKGDIVMLEALLAQAASTPANHDSDLAGRVEASLASRKSKAATSRDWQGRAFWTTSALSLCVAHGSLQLYSDTLLWARRFNKDPNTVKQVYLANGTHTEMLNLLSVPLAQRQLDNSKTYIRTHVQDANRILLQLLETAAMAVAEPSFQRWDWHETLALPGKVVEKRLRAEATVQQRYHLTDDEVFEAIWQPTICLVVDAEHFLLKPGLQKLYPREITRILHDISCPRRLSSPSARFLDTLSQARDELWREYRSRHFPKVFELGSPWPRGLPIQYLCPVAAITDFGQLPTVYARVEALIFASPELLLSTPPSDKQSRATIGPFVDDYNYALKAYVYSTGDQPERDRRIRKIWRHTLGSFTSNGMTKPEAAFFWARIFERNDIKLPHDLKAELPARPEPRVPDVDDTEVPTEWNPDAGYEAILETRADSRDVPAKIIYQLLSLWDPYVRECDFDKEARWIDTFWIDGQSTESFWALSRLKWPHSAKSIDGMVVAHLLYTNTRHGADHSILKAPFPSVSDVRYPGLYLDQDFMESIEADSNDDRHPSVAENLLKLGPPSLLSRVASSVLRRVEETEKSDSDTMPRIDLAMSLVRALIGSDRPSLAFPIIRDIILERPNDSAWHRTLLYPGLFNRLPPAQAKGLLDDIARGLLEKLDEQATRAKEERTVASDESSKPPPLVKVTTVKMLAKLLSDTPSLDIETSLQILADLLEKARHIDIRAAVIESLHDTLMSETITEQAANTIMDLLEQHAVPLAAALSERGDPAAPWEEVAAGADLPRVTSTGSETPVRQLFVNWKWDAVKNPSIKAKLVGLIGQVIKKSAENHRLWMVSFLKRNDFAIPLGQTLPILPVEPRILFNFAASRDNFPCYAFDAIRSVTLANACPPPWLEAITKKIRRTPALKESEAGLHWLSIFHDNVSTQCGANLLIESMHMPWSEAVTDPAERVSPEMIQNFARQLLDSHIQSGDISRLEDLFAISKAKVVAQSDLRDFEQWRSTTLPIFEDAIACVQALRTPQWQRDLNRQPRKLPNVFLLKVRLFALPANTVLEREFVRRLTELITELAEHGRPYHDDWAQLKDAAIRVHASWRPHLVRLGVLLGSLEGIDVENLALADRLRIEMARHVLEGGHRFDPEERGLETEVKTMLRSWATFPVEEFRTSAEDFVAQVRG
ncbi:hypothetical protein C8034_v000563 [Colletotrichum sidae]|uniref:Uncharacterized protein n=1 Tax=Colletotrichum sidae TaxID=1347389 RepID=A0A4R8TFH6_9PEZI|nr:hypothetical protein C8034_v000563 [Colletotrichum sidae]